MKTIFQKMTKSGNLKFPKFFEFGALQSQQIVKNLKNAAKCVCGRQNLLRYGGERTVQSLGVQNADLVVGTFT